MLLQCRFHYQYPQTTAKFQVYEGSFVVYPEVISVGLTSGYRQVTVMCMTGRWEDQITQRAVQKQQREALVLVTDDLQTLRVLI